MRSYLIVDDNRLLAENLAEIVRDQGDRAVVAASGAEALLCARESTFDVVLTDLRMPSMDGAELLHTLRETDPGLPAIVVTAFTSDAGIRAGEREAPLAVLPKPVPVDQLLHLLSVARRDARIVLIEDDPALAANITEVLQGRGFSVVSARSVAEVDGLASTPPFLAVVDLRVPGAPDGGAVERIAIRFPGTPILVATAFRDVPIPAGVERVFWKPFATAELVDVVEGAHAARQPRSS